MRLKDRFCETAGFEQCKAQQHGIAHAAPDCHDDVIFQSDILYQHSVNCHTDDDEKRLKTKRQQGTEIILSHTAPFLAHHGCHRKRRNGCDKVYLDHTAINDDKDTDIQRPHGNANKEGLEPKPE